ncbi:hypothetical protein DRP77_01500 [Candidatus Poribacteria bacterium]|nr:MAG: hypothetical protein DRP77_01500 [Candidatus Poribacteria bacterium]
MSFGELVVPESWERLAEEVVGRGEVILLLGRVDTGKTTLCRYLAAKGLEKGLKVGVVDADIGQSWIGPPTCIGMKLLTESIDQLRDEPDGIYFVGAISPPGHLLECVVGTRMMVEEARGMGAEMAVIDTTGLVDGDVGRALKRAKILAVRPTRIVAVQERDELEPFLRGLEPFEIWRVHRLEKAPQVMRKSHDYRVNYRELRFKEYFSRCSPFQFDFDSLRSQRSIFLNGRPLSENELKVLSRLLGDMVLYAEMSGEAMFAVTPDPVESSAIRRVCGVMRLRSMEVRTPEWFKGLLVGLLDGRGRVCSLGVIEEVNFASRKLTITCRPGSERAVAIQFSGFRVRGNAGAYSGDAQQV